ncbi:MAG TPA: hypothetical protein VHF89_06180 [Solirubrobacteraceae bacterium]|nr:hypothetical protein [Solirubrobacteraceae bacterium]
MRGAYGLAISSDPPLPHLVAAPPAWRGLEVRQERRRAEAAVHAVRAERASIAIAPGMRAEVDRGTRTAVLVADEPWPPAALTHPFLAAPAGLFAWWEGREALHGGAFAGAAGTWALLAPRGGGKSTTLARLALEGVPVVADDLAVVDAGVLAAGPRCLDLTPEAAHRLGVDGARDDARSTKVRMTLPGVAPETPLAGVVHLAWGDRVELVPVPPAERLARLVAHRFTWRDPADPVALLDLAALPAYELRRPPGLDSLERVVAALRGL